MRMPHGLILILALAITACADRDRDVRLTRIKNTGEGPDEFSVLPGKPLEAPESYSELPPPAPGGANRTDPDPKAEGIAALGGDPSAAARTGVSARDEALVGQARRYGVQPDIRQVLAAEDKEVRRRHGRVNILNIGRNDDYVNAYRRQWLDPYAELNRLRRRGVKTPSAPPKD
ncbi:DUF3035 domain-containing protein [Roseovarius sp. TE539]|uniref:DUF3035 domain-containing protein n=1 Tax=Roseovarius sp. TE539 TaxID=2249812 RepID=UPI000DE04503|nr:DUF3035 domain-containing protein [Roseovarius sp. TE539]RBI73974.1 DUF3035 domain-containing protein [Roseovarius sp. TE539]